MPHTNQQHLTTSIEKLVFIMKMFFIYSLLLSLEANAKTQESSTSFFRTRVNRLKALGEDAALPCSRYGTQLSTCMVEASTPGSIETIPESCSQLSTLLALVPTNKQDECTEIVGKITDVEKLTTNLNEFKTSLPRLNSLILQTNFRLDCKNYLSFQQACETITEMVNTLCTTANIKSMPHIKDLTTCMLFKEQVLEKQRTKACKQASAFFKELSVPEQQYCIEQKSTFDLTKVDEELEKTQRILLKPEL